MGEAVSRRSLFGLLMGAVAASALQCFSFCETEEQRFQRELKEFILRLEQLVMDVWEEQEPSEFYQEKGYIILPQP